MAANDQQEIDEIRSLAREFAQAELRPHTEKWDHERNTGDALHGQLAELGFFGVTIPERFGGMELALPSVAAIIEELAYGEASVGLGLAMHAGAASLLLAQGSDAQKSAWLEKLASGDALACFAIAEDAGSDAASITTTATRSADGFVLNGAKRWVTNGMYATFAFVLAKVDGGHPAMFIVEMNNPGVTIGERDDTLGLRPLPINTVTFKDCRVAGDAMLGGSPDASSHVHGAPSEQILVAAISVGIARAALDHATQYASIREQFKQPLREFEGIQNKLADMATCTAAASALLQQAAQSGDAQQAAMAKLFATTTATEVTRQAVQVYGGYGYMRDYPVEKLMRDSKAMEMLGGTNELLRVAVAKALYQD